MTMESGAENQQSGDAAVTEAENQQMTVQAQPQIATLAQVLNRWRDPKLLLVWEEYVSDKRISFLLEICIEWAQAFLEYHNSYFSIRLILEMIVLIQLHIRGKKVIC